MRVHADKEEKTEGDRRVGREGGRGGGRGPIGEDVAEASEQLLRCLRTLPNTTPPRHALRAHTYTPSRAPHTHTTPPLPPHTARRLSH
eukprot:3400895-Rhodomonas_salina.1